jgi:hypothetical protein
MASIRVLKQDLAVSKFTVRVMLSFFAKTAILYEFGEHYINRLFDIMQNAKKYMCKRI